MHWLLWVFIAVFFGISYRVGYKIISGQLPPLFSVTVISLIASLVCFTLYILKEHDTMEFAWSDVKTFWPLVILGIILAGLEISILMIYRSGGPLSISQSLSSSMVGIIVFAIGILFFSDKLNTGQIIGFFMGLSGVSMITYYSYGK